MKVLMHGPVHPAFLLSISSTFNEHTFFLMDKIYARPKEYYPPLPQNIQQIPVIQNLKELDNFDLYLGIAEINIAQQVRNWKIPKIWRTYTPISSNYELFTDPIVYNSYKCRDGTLYLRGLNPLTENLVGTVCYDFVDPSIFKDWNGNNQRALIISGDIANRNEEFGGDIYRQISSKIPVDFPNRKWKFEELVKEYQNHLVYLEVTRTARIISGSMGEAMVTGMPIISTPFGEFDFLVTHEYNGFKTDNPEQIIEYFKRLVNNQEDREMMGRNSRLRGIKLFSKGEVRSAFESAFYLTNNKRNRKEWSVSI